MTAGEFGLWKRRLFTAELGFLPLPDPRKTIQTETGKKLLSLEKEFRTQGVKSDFARLPMDGKLLD